MPLTLILVSRTICGSFLDCVRLTKVKVRGVSNSQRCSQEVLRVPDQTFKMERNRGKVLLLLLLFKTEYAVMGH